MGKTDEGVGLLILAVILVIVAISAWDEYSDTKAKHDAICGGFMEALATLVGNQTCEEARTYMNLMSGVTAVCGIGALGCISSGLKKLNQDET